MVPELKDLSQEEQLKEMKRMWEQRRPGAVDRRTRGYEKKIRMRQCVKDIGKYSFPHRTVEKWNALDYGIVTAHRVHSFKGKLDKRRYGDKTL
ncbi:hypothetical protein E2C01_087288 [Portunus trituberculatus]|uniref:Uncharacterized protein n=1 Tax=Portunus trituberculatus TaxID=210409 RepID=A0A5B7J7R1_PORTR|nr:hypothetical protein [Portunus trituberculatus]